MKRILISAAICSALIACTSQKDEAAQPSGIAAQEAPVVTAPPTPEVPTGDAFTTALPQGVNLQPPYNARMDVAQENKNGSIGRRTEFEYLEGDATQAMSRLAESMAAAGFRSKDGPANDNGIIRQVFEKPGYGAVFARAQEEDAANRKNALARGFVVVAWPQGDGPSQAAESSE